MVHLFSMSGVKRLSMTAVVLGAFVFAAAPALSQELRDRGRDASEQRSTSEPHSTPDRGSLNLPGWAEPSGATGERDAISDPSVNPTPGEDMETRAPPPGGEPLPVDGGLALLAAAGAGYAVRRLRDEEDEDDPA